MSGVVLGPFRHVAAGGDLDSRLPAKHSLRRAAQDSKLAVVAASELLGGAAAGGRMGAYVAQQRGSLEYLGEFIRASYALGPRLASPLHFSESVANISATHLSLTLGFRDGVQTFIGSRTAGVQAVRAAAEDLETGIVDAALIVVLGLCNDLTRDAYAAVYSTAPAAFESSNGAVAFLMRRGGEGARLRYAGAVCCGRGRAARERAEAMVWEECRAAGVASPRVLRSAFALDGGERSGESFALDPFLRLLEDSGRAPEATRAVVCLGEEGMVGLLALEGPLVGGSAEVSATQKP